MLRPPVSAIGCDASFIALPLLGCLARAIGNKRVIRLKKTWTEPAIVWAAIIGKSGTHKTPALQASTVFLNQAQEKSITEFHEADSKFDQDMQLYDRDYSAWKRSKTTEPPPWKPRRASVRAIHYDRLHDRGSGIALAFVNSTACLSLVTSWPVGSAASPNTKAAKVLILATGSPRGVPLRSRWIVRPAR